MPRARKKPGKELVAVNAKPDVLSLGGGLEGAERTSRETMTWNPSRLSPDQIINGLGGLYGQSAKDEADARGRDVVTNDGYAQGVVNISRDNIVGSQFRLNSQPNFTVLQNEISKSFNEDWAAEFQIAMEEKFNLIAESDDGWFDACREQTFTGLVRLAVGGFVYTGEALATSEWIRQSDRPFSTAIQLISPARLSNPNYTIDTPTLRKGVEKDQWGAPIAYWIQNAYPTEYINPEAYKWTRVAIRKPWAREDDRSFSARASRSAGNIICEGNSGRERPARPPSGPRSCRRS